MKLNTYSSLKSLKFSVLFLLLIVLGSPAIAQVVEEKDELPKERNTSRGSELWNGLYTKYRVGEKLYYYGEYHIRTRDNFVDRMAQVYLRFGMSYILNKNLEITAGVVTPFYWAPASYEVQEDPFDKVVNQFRFWQQFLFIQSLGRAKVYHQIRTEQRWKRDYIVDSPFKLSYRWRYKIATYIPINTAKLQKGTYFVSLYNELFIQTGKTVILNPMEDNRTFVGLGYILNENIQLQAGYAKSYQQRDSGVDYVNRDLIRFSIYHNLDFTKRKRSEVEFQPLF